MIKICLPKKNYFFVTNVMNEESFVDSGSPYQPGSEEIVSCNKVYIKTQKKVHRKIHQ